MRTLSLCADSHDVLSVLFLFFFNDTATTEIYTLSLHDALPILGCPQAARTAAARAANPGRPCPRRTRSEEHTSELQSRVDLVCRLLLEKKKKTENSGGKRVTRSCHLTHNLRSHEGDIAAHVRHL